jgi:hypothetical protein
VVSVRVAGTTAVPRCCRAHVVVGLVLEAVAHAALQQAEAQLVLHAARGHVALQVEAARGLRAALVVAAKVVDVEGAVRAVAVVVAFGAAAKGVGQPVVGLQALLAYLRAPAPVGVQRLAERTVPVSALNTEGCDHGWLFRLMRGSTGAGSTLPSRLKPFWLGCVLRLCSTSNSSTESRVMRQSAASENRLRLPSRLW